MTDDTDDIDVHLTATAKSKCHRMLSAYELRRVAEDALAGDEDRIKQRLDPQTGEQVNDYHIRRGRYSVVCKWDEEHDGDGHPDLIVVTQSHAHANYSDTGSWTHVNEVAL